MLTVNAFSQLFSHQTWWFIQNVNLIFHEAGHVVLMFFGNLLHVLGGTIFEIGVPAIVIVHFARSKQWFSAAFASWWLSTAFLSVSIYASDARERVLSLITNDVSTHDWYNLLSMLGILKYDDIVGGFFWACSLLSIVLMWWLLYQDQDVRLYHRHAREYLQS